MSREKPTLPRQRQPCDLPSEKSTASFWHSEPSPLLLGHRSTRELPSTADVVIIGSGMTGASVARHLLHNEPNQDDGNLNVVMLEAREACWGATGRNGGHCQPLLFEHPHDPEVGQFELDNFYTLQRMIRREGIDCEWVSQQGVRGIYSAEKVKSAEDALHTMQTTAPKLAAYMRLVKDKDELASYRIATADGAMVTSIAARMWPYKLVSHILEELLTSSDLNGRFNLQTLTPAESVEPADDGTWTVKTARGSIQAKRIVLATNAYTSHLLPNFADLIVPCRGEMSALKPFLSLSGDNRLKTSFGFEGDGLDDYLIQRPTERGGHLMFGGGRTEAPSLGVTDDSVIDEKTAAYLRRQLAYVFDLPEKTGASAPPAEMEATHQWTGIMGFSRDELPWVGPVPGKEGLFMAAGFTGHGMPNTWLSGKAAASMVKTSLHSRDLSHIVQQASAASGLPRAYQITEERVKKAMSIDDVELREQEETARVNRVDDIQNP